VGLASLTEQCRLDQEKDRAAMSSSRINRNCVNANNHSIKSAKFNCTAHGTPVNQAGD
jgi:hypothetical protein